MDNQQKLVGKILQSAAYMNKMARSGAGNYIITSKQVSDMISEIMTDRISTRKRKIKTILEWNKWEIE